jgi:hypothetical protein
MRRSVSPLILIAGVIFGFFILLIGFATVVGRFAPEQKFSRIDELQRVSLPDGTDLVLHAVTFGTAHSVETRRAFRGSTAFGGRIEVQPLDAHVHRNRMLVWMSCQETDTGRFVNPDWWKRSSVEDENGVLHEDTNAHRLIKTQTGSSSSGLSRPFKDEDATFSLASDPDRILVVYSEFQLVRATGMLKLHVYSTEDKEVAVLDFPNPAPAPAAEWIPETMPLTTKNGPLQLTLKSVSCRQQESRYHHDNEVTIQMRQQLQTEFELTENGVKAKNWHVNVDHVEDVLGNTSNVYDVTLSFFEPAWKLSVQVYREEDAEFPEECIQSLGTVALQQPGHTEQIGKTLSLTSGDVKSVLVGGSGTTRFRIRDPAHSGDYSHHGSASVRLPGEDRKTKYVRTLFNSRNGNTDVEIDSAPLPYVFLQFPGWTGNQVIYARGTDEIGRTVPAQITQSTSDGMFVWLTPVSDAKEVTIDLITDKRHQFEFYIKPPEKDEKQD